MKVHIAQKNYWVILIKRRWWLKWALFVCFALLALSAAGFYYYLYHYTGGFVDDMGRPLDFNKLANSDFKKTSYVYADDKITVIGRFFDEIRDSINISEVPDVIKNAFVAAEDSNFYRYRFYNRDLNFGHSGIDPLAIVRAGTGNILHSIYAPWGVKSGASTINDQLSRQLYADEIKEFKERQQTFWRKIREARIAIRLDKIYPKDKILEGFLNMPYFGHGVNGVAEATHRYFGKNIRKNRTDLIRIAAILASINKSPSIFCPIYHKPPEPKIDENWSEEKKQKIKTEYEVRIAREHSRILRARERYNYVLLRMFEEGYITKEKHDKAYFSKDEPLQLEIVDFQPLKNQSFGHGARMAKETLFGMGFSDEEITDSGGLRIFTGINLEIQRIATDEFTKHLALLNSELPENHEKLEGAFVIIDNQTGKILALSGGHNFDESQYNRVMASRSAGSGAKPLTYAAAFEFFNKTFDDKICNCPFTMRGGAPGKTWSPKNFREDHPVPNGYIPLPIGMIRSVNLATLNLARDIGMDTIIETAHRIGIWGNPKIVRDSDGNIWFKEPGQELRDGLVPLLPTAIGASDMNLLEITNAYSVFAREGIYLKPLLVTRVEDSEGQMLYKGELPVGKEVLTKETADKVLTLMRAVTKIGTAKISMRDIKQQVAIKTGTSNGPRDVGMFGGPPDITMGIRMGYDSGKNIELPQYMKKISGRADMQVSGGWVVGPLFRRIIDKIYEKRPITEFQPEIEEGLRQLLEKLENWK